MPERKKLKTTRLYYAVDPETGKRLYWTLKVKDATKPVMLDGTVEDAMSGKAGVSVGCHMSVTAMNNKKQFPHPVYFISFSKSAVKVIDKITKGQPSHCVRYRHYYGRYVDLNDKDPSKRVIKAHPELFNRQFTLHPYKSQKAHWRPEYGRKETGERSTAPLLRGEVARMQAAGLINLPFTA